ncbi:MAG: cytochrome b N-terminal domain-containing protein [Legionellaceae bacterium]|nr:cytochrome b N-terminal domain-containing protein [Legionellaceae bacterium]
MKNLIKWLDARLPLMSTWRRYLSDYYVPKNLNIYYCFGVLALVALVNQLVTGIWLTMFYTPTATEAFHSIESMMRDVHFGWLFRYMHSTGASAFFIVLYLHLFRGLLYGSYQRPRELVWILGVFLFVLILAEAFFGYLLPWGQMSYWSAQVITSLLGVIPYVGEALVNWVRGDFVVSNATLQRFFSLHSIALPLVVLFFVFLHVISLHHVGSNNPEGIDMNRFRDEQGRPLDGIPFYPYYVMKDFLAVLVFLILFFAAVFFCPDMGGYFLEPTNFIPANTLQTPDHIAPVWYMMPFYAMLRAIPNKTWGVVIMCGAVLILFFLPWLDKSPVRSMRYKGLYSKCALYGLVLSFILLGYLGSIDVTPIRQGLAIFCIIIYFAYFFLMPAYTRRERCQVVPDRISI